MTAIEGLGAAPDTTHAHTSVPSRVVIALIRSYQAVRIGRLSPCRFYPSCSAYALEAVERHGVVTGLLLAARRLSRCRPFGGSGVDLVPVEVRSRKRS